MSLLIAKILLYSPIVFLILLVFYNIHLKDFIKSFRCNCISDDSNYLFKEMVEQYDSGILESNLLFLYTGKAIQSDPTNSHLIVSWYSLKQDEIFVLSISENDNKYNALYYSQNLCMLVIDNKFSMLDSLDDMTHSCSVSHKFACNNIKKMSEIKNFIYKKYMIDNDVSDSDQIENYKKRNSMNNLFFKNKSRVSKIKNLKL